jgi:hypothetical protein
MKTKPSRYRANENDMKIVTAGEGSEGTGGAGAGGGGGGACLRYSYLFSSSSSSLSRCPVSMNLPSQMVCVFMRANAFACVPMWVYLQRRAKKDEDKMERDAMRVRESE